MDIPAKSIHFIAEAGINHNGDLELAKELISVAKMAGADSVKFQKRNPHVCVPEDQKSRMRETPWGEMSYLDYKLKIEFDREQYDEIDRFASEQGIAWSASPWDMESLEFLMAYNLPYIKVASALNTHKDLLREIAKGSTPVVLSTGMATLEDIDTAVSILQTGPAKEVTLLHTVSTYPAREEDLNLKFMWTLEERYGLPVGYSGHEASLTPSLVAAAFGASIIERHITLDRSMWGTDHSASLEPDGLSRLVSMCRKVPIVAGEREKREVSGEAEVAKKMRYWLD